MRRYFNIFTIYSQEALEVKSLSVVWFLTVLVGPLLMLVFWSGATKAQGGSIMGWDYASFASYYLLIALAGSLFTSHVEEKIATDDIKDGELTNYLLKPISYLKINFLDELPWRFIQGTLAILTIIFIGLVADGLIQITTSPLGLFLAIVSTLLAFFISFLFKMCLGLLAFWLTEINGVLLIFEIIMDICGGIIIPLVFLPSLLQSFLNVLPFAYMVYYPILSLLGKLTTQQQLLIICIQIGWLIAFQLLYKFLWSQGIKKYTAIGR